MRRISMTLLLFLCLTSITYAHTVYLSDGRILTGTVEGTKDNILYFKTILGVEKIEKHTIWKMVDDEGNIIFEDPSREPGTMNIEVGAPPTEGQSKTSPIPTTEDTTSTPFQETEESSSLQPASYSPMTDARPVKGTIGGFGGMLQLIDSDTRESWTGTMGFTGGGTVTVFVSGELGVTGSFAVSSSSLELKDWNARNGETPTVDLSHQIIRIGLRKGYQGLLLAAGYVSVTRKVESESLTEYDEEAKANGLFAQIGWSLPLGDSQKIALDILGTLDYAGEENWAGSVALSGGLSLIF